MQKHSTFEKCFWGLLVALVVLGLLTMISSKLAWFVVTTLVLSWCGICTAAFASFSFLRAGHTGLKREIPAASLGISTAIGLALFIGFFLPKLSLAGPATVACLLVCICAIKCYRKYNKEELLGNVPLELVLIDELNRRKPKIC